MLIGYCTEKSKENVAMKTAQLLVAAIVTLSSLPMLAQQANGSESGSAGMLPVKCELVNKLDTKSAKAGDQVVVKTTESFKTASGTEIPKGSRLLGTVTEVQAHGSDSPDSHVGIRFDLVELKGGQSLAIHSEIRSLSLPVSTVAAGSLGGMDSMGSMGGGGNGMGNARGGMAGGGPAGGTLGGAAGGAGGAMGGAASNAGRTAGTMNSAADDTTQATGRPAGSPSEAAGTLSGGAAGSGTAHATGIPGVMLAGRGSAASSASGTLSASKKNVHLDGGTQIVLGVAADQP
jgi:hypothetical protein